MAQPASSSAAAATTSSTPYHSTAVPIRSDNYLVKKFHEDGFLVIPTVLTPQFTAKLHHECMDIFNGVFEYLYTLGEIEFTESHRTRRNNNINNLRLEQSSVKNTKRNNDEYEYPLPLGMKNGYRELVMRSPGRYELVLLLDGFVPMTQLRDDENDYCNDGRWLLSKQVLMDFASHDKSAQNITQQNNQPNLISSLNSPNNPRRREHNCIGNTEDERCLDHLLSWIHEFPYCSDTKHKTEAGVNHCHHVDRSKMKQFMQLVDELLPPSSTYCSNNDHNAEDVQCSYPSGERRDGGGRKEGRWSKQEYGYQLSNLSLIVATPGSTSQSWHADGGHVNLSQHEKCHVFNVFIPLVDVPLSLGPTELRPGTHFHTRNLAPMMLAAKARKTLRPPVCPELKIGDALVFDYRILHRGMANVSDVGVDGDDDSYEDDEEHDSSDEGKASNCDTGTRSSCGKNRPVLVLTFARRWFKDVCNYPQRSMFSLQKEG